MCCTMQSAVIHIYRQLLMGNHPDETLASTSIRPGSLLMMLTQHDCDTEWHSSLKKWPKSPHGGFIIWFIWHNRHVSVIDTGVIGQFSSCSWRFSLRRIKLHKEQQTTNCNSSSWRLLRRHINDISQQTQCIIIIIIIDYYNIIIINVALILLQSMSTCNLAYATARD